MDPLTLFALANGAVSAIKAGCKLYKDIKGAAGDIKDVLKDLDEQFHGAYAAKGKTPPPAAVKQLNVEKARVKELNKQDFELSSFIDSKFLEECLAPVGNLNNKKIKKISVQKFIEIMENEQQDDKWLVADIQQIIDNRKRQKINEDDHI